jgi:putative ABC transport system ATP-binding protein
MRERVKRDEGNCELTVLEGRGLGRTYRRGASPVRALCGVDIRIERGELVVLSGPSGSGKTTLINVLGLLDRPDEGEILLEGRSVSGLDENARADLRRDRFGFVFQSFNLIAVLSALENVEYPLTLTRLPRATAEQRARTLLERVGLGGKEHVRPDLLSGGERQRVALARAIVNEPRVILADEPTANLDSRAAGDVLELMRELGRDHGASVVVATHDPRVVERGTRVIELRDGRALGDA